jgi:hypothetical protein
MGYVFHIFMDRCDMQRYLPWPGALPVWTTAVLDELEKSPAGRPFVCTTVGALVQYINNLF